MASGEQSAISSQLSAFSRSLVRISRLTNQAAVTIVLRGDLGSLSRGGIAGFHAVVERTIDNRRLVGDFRSLSRRLSNTSSSLEG